MTIQGETLEAANMGDNRSLPGPRRLSTVLVVALLGAVGCLKAPQSHQQGNGSGLGQQAQQGKVNDPDQDRIQRTVHLILRHSSMVHGVALSPDNKSLVSASADGSVKVWDLKTGNERFSVSGHRMPASCVVYHPRGDYLASAGVDGFVKVWNATSGMEKRAFQPHGGAWVHCVAFSPDGRHIASAGADGTVKVSAWNVETDKERITLDGNAGNMRCVAFCPDSTHLASAGGKLRSLGQCRVLIWAVDSGKQVHKAGAGEHHRAIYTIGYSPNGQLLASGGDDGLMKVWDTENKQQIHMYGTATAVRSLAFSPRGRLLVQGNADGNVIVWDTKSWQELDSFRAHDSSVECVSFSSDNRLFVSASIDTTVKVWHIGSDRHDGKPTK